MERKESEEILHEFRFFRVYTDGQIELLKNPPKIPVPENPDPITGVRCKDVVISTEPEISARIFLPRFSDPTKKLPVLYHVHGGAFCHESPCSKTYFDYLTAISAEAEAIILSVEYGLFPDRPIPACYEDSWAGLQWVSAHADGNGPDPWLNNNADFKRVFIGGESAGANISHNLAVRVGSVGLPGVKFVGLVLVHPYFGGTDDDESWLYMCPGNSGLEDPRLKPAAADLARIGCERVLVMVAEKDLLCPMGKEYIEELKKTGWPGNVEMMEDFGEGHGYFFEDLTSHNAQNLMKRFACFLKRI